MVITTNISFRQISMKKNQLQDILYKKLTLYSQLSAHWRMSFWSKYNDFMLGIIK